MILFMIKFEVYVNIGCKDNRVGGKRSIFLLLSFSDLSHHRTCGSAYGGSYFGYHSRYEPVNVA